ncbi:MAG: hypothetical protein ABR582_02625 [Gemmatimonadaceae bacterium]
MIARIFFGLALVGMVGCLQPTDTGASSVSLTGRWQYSAVQSGAAGNALNGTLVISQQSGASFQGTISVSSINAETGETRSLAGTLSGSSPTVGAIDFDVSLEQLPRRHVGQLVGDTLSGTWLSLSDQGVAASGTFTARRLRN